MSNEMVTFHDMFQLDEIMEAVTVCTINCRGITYHKYSLACCFLTAQQKVNRSKMLKANSFEQNIQDAICSSMSNLRRVGSQSIRQIKQKLHFLPLSAT